MSRREIARAAADLDRRGAPADPRRAGQGAGERSSASTARRACSAPTTARSAGGGLRRKTVSFWPPRLRPERRPFRDMDTASSDKRGSLRAPARRRGRTLMGAEGAGQRLPDRLPRPAPRHRPADRAARVGVGRGGHLPGQRGAGAGPAARRDRAGAGRTARAARAPGAIRGARTARRSRPARPPAEMALDPGSVWLDARGTQSVGHAERGIARYVTEHALALLELAPETIGWSRA